MKNQTSKNVANIVFVAACALVLLIPLATINWERNVVSESENRILHDPPSFPVDTEHFRAETELWLGDKIGLRSQFNDIYFNVILRVLSPLNVHVGKEGWLFYLSNGNMLLLQGNYWSSQDTVDEIVAAQQQVSDAYRAKNIDYYFMPVPSKVGVYPEFTGVSYAAPLKTPLDEVVERLFAETDVKLIPAKESILDEKSRNQVYFRQDTHWNHRGSYAAYRAAIDALNAHGYDLDTVEVAFAEGAPRTGDLSNMLNGGQFYAPEETMEAVWDTRFVTIEETAELSRYKNETAPEKKLLIYGDSQCAPELHLPHYLAESFSEVVFYRNWVRSPELEANFAPDVVIYEVAERYLREHVLAF